jgi:hypothetical protein
MTTHTELERRIQSIIQRRYGLNYSKSINILWRMRYKGYVQEMEQLRNFGDERLENASYRDNYFMIVMNEFFIYNKDLMDLYLL